MDSSVDRGKRLFEYLAALQKTRETPIEKTSDYVRSDGIVIPLDTLSAFVASGHINIGPEIREGFASRGTQTSPNESDQGLLVEFCRFEAPKFPEIPDEVKPWIIDTCEDSKLSNVVRSAIERDGEVVKFEEEGLDLRNSVNSWLVQWKVWAKADQYQQKYAKAFELASTATENADEFELVLGLGNLRWKTNTVDLDRHIFTVPLSIRRDGKSGKIKIEVLDPIIRLESDAIPMEEVADSTFVSRVRSALSEVESEVLQEASFSGVATTTARSLTTKGEYSPVFSKSDARTVSADIPQLTWYPTIILRKRGKIGLSQVFLDIAEEISRTASVPEGLMALIDPNRAVHTTEKLIQGGVFEVGEDIYSPLPLNERQIQVLKRVDSYNQTIVQGPPGTGKTHMAAALLSHLLAQGKRVLVTAEKERALYELRGKLPKEIRELAVSVIGTQAGEQVELQNAINTVSNKADLFSTGASSNQIHNHKLNLERLREDSIKLRRKWYEHLERENSSIGIEGYGENLSQAVTLWKENTLEHKWINAFHIADLGSVFPLEYSELTNLFDLHIALGTADFSEVDEVSAFNLHDIFPPAGFRDAIDNHGRLVEELKSLATPVIKANAKAWKKLSQNRKDEVQKVLRKIEDHELKIDSVNCDWKNDLIADVENDQSKRWYAFANELEKRIERATKSANYLSQFRRIDVDGEISKHVHNAREIAKLVKTTGPLKVDASGMPKVGLFTKKIVKDSREFFESVRVDGVPPTDEMSVMAYIAHVDLGWELEGLSDFWQYADQSHSNSTVGKIEAFEIERQKILDLISAAAKRQGLVKQVVDLGIKQAENSPISRAIEDCLNWINISNRLRELELEISSYKVGDSDALWANALNSAVQMRDIKSYEKAYSEFTDLKQIEDDVQQYRGYLAKIKTWSKDIHQALVAEGFSSMWFERLTNIEATRRWLLAGKQIRDATSSEFHSLQSKIAANDVAITNEISQLAARRAWHQALSGNRIDASMRKTLKSYTQAVKRLGKGTGKNADQKRRDVRRHLNECRAAVPIWIMPIARVIEQFTFTENMFDVVIVDEASQAGMDAIFLQYIAKKLVVIGDDQQVSPSAIGVNDADIRKLASQYIKDFEEIDAWTDPKRSLFDEADMRYGGRIVLNEHRRCVPEIIEFSNELAYRPNKVELIPVREVKAGRLAPFKITQTPNAPSSGSGSKKVNQQEANVLVAKLIECLNDPTYEGKTFGVISLLSSKAQVDYIRARLNTLVAPDAWDKFDIRVGNPADFQGSERDVIFLSMVESAEPGKRHTTLTRQDIVQRYNVAVSRAKDQIQLFHSAGIDDLPNTEDVRHKLLAYAYRVANAAPEISGSTLVSNDERDAQFDSLFEQRVYNRIVSRGFQVKPQFKALNYSIDLVVEGESARLAIECDGDHWHSSPEQVENDRRRQSILERAGWKFVRIFESDFYLDAAQQMDRIWQALDDLGIEPGQIGTDDFIEADNIEIIESVSEWSGRNAHADNIDLVTSLPG